MHLPYKITRGWHSGAKIMNCILLSAFAGLYTDCLNKFELYINCADRTLIYTTNQAKGSTHFTLVKDEATYLH